jgi:hypothetical protein
MLAATRRRSSFAALQLTIALVCGVTTACWIRPVEPSPGADVKVTFAEPHAIAVRPDSELVVSELAGRLVAVRGDTVVLVLTRVPGRGNTAAWGGHEVTFNRDAATKIEQTSFDGSPTSIVALVGLSWLIIWLFNASNY